MRLVNPVTEGIAVFAKEVMIVQLRKKSEEIVYQVAIAGYMSIIIRYILNITIEIAWLLAIIEVTLRIANVQHKTLSTLNALRS